MKNKDSFEESRRVWKGVGFIKYKSSTGVFKNSSLFKKKFSEFVVTGRTKWTERELNIFEFNQQ